MSISNAPCWDSTIVLLYTCIDTILVDNADPLQQNSRMTAFVFRDSELRVECWEIGTLLLSSDQQTTRQCDSKRAPRVMQMDVGEGKVTGVDIITYAAPAAIWPSSEISSEALDFSLAPSYVVLMLIHTSTV